MVNPYICYILSFATALLVYGLGWSDLYPPLMWPLLMFLSITVIACGILGLLLFRKKKISFQPIFATDFFFPACITFFIYSLWFVEFLYEGGIPLVKILLKLPYDYRLFGVPSLHVFVVTFSSFYTVYLFHLYLSSRKKQLLILCLINLMAAVLIYSRAMFFFNLASCFFLFLLTVRRIPKRMIFAVPVALTVLFYLFGVLGTLRMSREASREYDNAPFMKTGKASQAFRESAIPKEFFWSYIYISSPLANLQHNVRWYKPKPVTAVHIGEMVNNEILMDFISKRVNAFFQRKQIREYTMPGPFNVSTVYSRSYSYLGWTGLFIMALVVLTIPLIYLKMLPVSSPFFLTGFVILCTLYLFLAYDNMIRFTGLCFQLVYPVLLHVLSEKVPFFRKLFVNNKVTEA